jgi:hypothetical protein
MGSSKYFKRSINQANIGSNLNNTLSSSISYNKTFNTIPGSRISLSATPAKYANRRNLNDFT